MNSLLAKAAGKKNKWIKQPIEDETDSEEDLSSDDEFDVSLNVIYTLYNNRYIPIKYIGRGTFSRVWITYDIQENRLCAMKCIFSEYKEEAMDEIKRNKLISSLTEDIKLSKIMDNFIHKTGEICLITELLGVNLMNIIDTFEGMIEINCLKQIVRDILEGLKTLHSLRLIHTDLKPENILSNIYTRGFLFYKDIFENKNNFKQEYDSIIEKLLPENYSSFDKSKKKKVKRTVKVKAGNKLCEHIKEVVNKEIIIATTNFEKEHSQITELNENVVINLDVFDESEPTTTEANTSDSFVNVFPNCCEGNTDCCQDDANSSCSDNDYYTFKDFQNEITLTTEDITNSISIKIIDFGNCEEFDSDKNQDEISVRSYRPPENFMNSGFNEKADMWTLGCLIFEMLTGEYLFEIDSDCDQNERDRRYLFEMFKILGKVPKNLCLDCEFSKELFDKKGRILKMKSVDHTSISEILNEEFNYEQETAQELETILKLFLEYKVQDRISAEEGLSLDWLTN